MGFHQQTMTEAEIAAARQQVLQTVRQTRLGRGLLGALNKAQVKIVFSEHISIDKDSPPDKNLHGLYDSRINTLVVDATAPLHAQLHFFAHEARHALQMREEKKINDATKNASIHLLSPELQLYGTRLREIDADVFAVCFVAQHDIHTGSRHFSKMLERGGFFSSGDPYGRADLYEAFLERWSRKEDPASMAHSARSVMSAFMEKTPILNAYNNFSLQVWEKVIWAAAVEHAEKPRSDYYKSFRAAALKKDSGETPRDIFNARAAAYSKILVKSGAQDYLQGVDLEALCTFICESNPLAKPGFSTGYAFERALEKFDLAIHHYTQVPQKPANSNVARPPAKNKARPKQ